MSSVPEAVRRLAAEREAARRAKDFALADDLRERIRTSGFEVQDSANGPVLSPVRGVWAARGPTEIVDLLDQPPAFDATVHWVVEGWPEDVRRGIGSFDRHHPGTSIQHVVVDLTGTERAEWPDGVDLVGMMDRVGWSNARNAGLTRSLGRIVLVVDGSIEANGDVLSPISVALDDAGVGVTGPFGIVTDDLREFRESPGPDVDAVEAYLMALRRDLVVDGLRFDHGFRFYRSADIELSFQIKSMGLRATVTPVPVIRHDHRMWANTPPDRRAALSKRNHYRFLDRWRGRLDLTVAGSGSGGGHDHDPREGGP